jgi:micrococcal nuclease
VSVRSPIAALLVGALALGLAACGDGSSGASDGAASSTVVAGEDGATVEPNARLDHVVDGDTIDVITADGREERVRLTGIDTPEVAHEASSNRPATPGECFGDEATEFVRGLLPVGTELHLERDVVGRDDYGRLLAYVYRTSDGLFVNDEIVRRGYAQPLTIPPNVTFSEQFVGAAREAEAGDLGLWSACADG